MSGTRAVCIEPGQGTTIEGPVGGPLTFKVRGEQTNAALTVFENVIPPGAGPPLHTHANEDESWYVLDGELRFRIGEEIRSAPAGSFVFVPRRTAHCFQTIGDTPARVLVVFNPSGMERFFDRLAASGGTSDDREVFKAIGAECGMAIVGPPLAEADPTAP